MKSQTQATLEHALLITVHILEQLQKFIVTEEELSGTKHQKRFLGGLLTAVSAIGSLFSIGLSAANLVSLGTIKKQVSELREEMPEIQQRLFIQQQQLQGIGRMLQGTILTVNMHSALLNNTIYALSKLSHIVETETSMVCMIRDLMSDLQREVSSSVNSLSGGTIPSYLVPLSMVENFVQSATTTTVQTSQVHLAYSLGSAIPIYVNPENLEVGFILNLPIIEKQNIYRLKSVLNMGFWQEDTSNYTPRLTPYPKSLTTLNVNPVVFCLFHPGLQKFVLSDGDNHSLHTFPNTTTACLVY